MDTFQAKGFAMAIDAHYIPAFSIEDVILDKDTGAPLSGGKVYFEQDNQRGVLKPVFQITGTSPNYTFVPLTNPVILSSIGTFEDALGNPVIPYYYPFDAELNPEYYYVRVESADGVSQFTREAQPYIAMDSTTSSLTAISNEISNPQFAVVNYDTSASSYTYTLGAGANQVLDIAPDWSLVASVDTAGTVTVEQTQPSGSLNIPTNPGTILSISSTGLSRLLLRTRQFGSPNLWGNGYISASFVAKTYSGTSVNLNLYYSQSNGTVTDQQFLPSASLLASGNYQQYFGTVSIPISNSSDAFPSGYIDIYFDIPLGIKIDITSVMIAFTGNNSVPELQYDQETTSRQIDHLYHYAYPIVPVGTIIDFAGFGAPAHYLECDGTAYSRETYYQLFSALTHLESVNLTSGINTFTVANGNIYSIGMGLEGTGIVATTTITNIVGNTITMSIAASATVLSSVRFFIGGAPPASTTFLIPDLRGYAIAGAGVPNGFSLLTSYGSGANGGSNTHTLTSAELPPHTHTYTNSSEAGGSYTFAAGAVLQSNAAAVTGNGPGTSTPFNIIQPTKLMRKCIRYQ